MSKENLLNRPYAIPEDILVHEDGENGNVSDVSERVSEPQSIRPYGESHLSRPKNSGLPKAERTLTRTMRYIAREQSRPRERVLGINQISLSIGTEGKA